MSINFAYRNISNKLTMSIKRFILLYGTNFRNVKNYIKLFMKNLRVICHDESFARNASPLLRTD